MALSSQKFIFNLDKSFNAFKLYAKQNDSTGARSFIFNVFQNGKPFNLTGVTASVGGRKPDAKEVFNNVNILDTQNGEIEVPLSTQMLVIAGTLNLELIFFKDSVRLSSYPFSVSIIPNVTNLSTVQSSDEFNALSTAMGRVNSSIDDMNNKTNQAITDLKSKQIGTVNLLTGTQFFDNNWIKGDGTAVKIDTKNLFEGCAVQLQWYNWNYFYQIVSYEIGETYTISCYAKTDCSQANLYFTLSDVQSTLGCQQLTSNWKKYSFTFIAKKADGRLRVESTSPDYGNGKIYVSKIKLEKGVIATDWSPNPLDYKNEIGNGDNLLGKLSLSTDRVVFEVTNLEKGKYYTLDLGDIEFDGTGLAIYDFEIDYIGNFTGLTQQILESMPKIKGTYTFQIIGNIDKTKKYNLVFWGHNINNTFKESNKRIKLENGYCATGFNSSLNNIMDNIETNTKQISSNSSSISDIQHNWFSDCSNSLCINGFTSLKVYAQGVYYITGDSVTELQSIDHSEIKNGQCVYFIAETASQTAAIKFPASLNSSTVYTPKGQDFWITGRDNGDMIYRMQKMGGAMRFLA